MGSRTPSSEDSPLASSKLPTSARSLASGGSLKPVSSLVCGRGRRLDRQRAHRPIARGVGADRLVLGERQVREASFIGVETLDVDGLAGAQSLLRRRTRALDGGLVVAGAEPVAVDHDT